LETKTSPWKLKKAKLIITNNFKVELEQNLSVFLGRLNNLISSNLQYSDIIELDFVYMFKDNLDLKYVHDLSSSKPLRIGGVCRAVIGSHVVFEDNGVLYMSDLSKFKSHIVNFNFNKTVQLPSTQYQLF
jgi:hypothetical protein